MANKANGQIADLGRIIKKEIRRLTAATEAEASQKMFQLQKKRTLCLVLLLKLQKKLKDNKTTKEVKRALWKKN